MSDEYPPGTLLRWMMNRKPPAGWAWFEFEPVRTPPGIVQIGFIIKLDDTPAARAPGEVPK